jgi:hypothetical protein
MGKIADLSSVDDVVEAYEDQGIPAFAIFHDSQLKQKWTPSKDEGIEEGAAKLRSYLQRIEGSGSGSYAIYTLRVYENPGGSIKSNAPYDSSVNFQFNRGRAPGLAGVGDAQTSYKGSSYTDLAVENALLKKRVEDLEDELDNPKDDGGGAIGMIDKISQLPGMDNVIGALAGKLAQLLMGKNQIQEPPPGFHEPSQPMNFNNMNSLSGIPNLDDAKRIEIALSELEKRVKDLPDILEKLSRMSKQQPFKFNLFLSTLRNMQI